MAELSTLARPYAKAAFEYAREKDALAQWSEQLATAAAVSAAEGMDKVLDNPSMTDAQQAATLNEVCGDATGAEVKNFVNILSDNKRLSLLPEISAQFELFKANLEKSVDVEVVSAFDLDDATAEKLAGVLGKKLEREVKVSTSTDAGLLGGVLIRAGDLVIDGSVRGRLNKLAEAMNS
ncbi:F0F1 ATP synthase subunit delta [Halioglobus japonicus]|uniref:ATP synthase subunit delta n=1 Tax=Halioglobus japonicus TaxID=930805 RepID=A0AAP8SM93_9GAMM|nr:F0F1 ATP synthase subunit delta [Halioglobus japonicus]AQA17367.1 F0F1 ATP synthase subunit delta [Halioglobus japonicus]PLW85289.1 F0F1 ATP synthase subunit delta [Halioglobus japonicus]GHD22520.1 ATP synthase subunit delta [Halioglobus japonicus]